MNQIAITHYPLLVSSYLLQNTGKPLWKRISRECVGKKSAQAKTNSGFGKMQ